MTPAATEPARAFPLVEVDAHEGPVYAPDEDALYFTTVRAERVAIKRLDLVTGCVDVLRADANQANGMAMGADGRLVVCEQGTLETPARITAVDRATGAAETLVEEGLASPNDVVLASDGSIWFTDPSYGWLQGFRPRPAAPDRVYRLDPSGRLDVVSEAFDKPNGLAFAPDERTLYVGDSGAIHAPDDYDEARPRAVYALETGARRTSLVQGSGDSRADAGTPRVFADAIPGFPDGLKVDSAGRVYVSCERGIRVYDPDGSLIEEIAVPGAVNFALGPGESVLYATADTAVWAVRIDPKGARP